MIDKLKQIEDKMILELLSQPNIWNSLMIDYHPPVVERLWTQIGNYRVSLHFIHACVLFCSSRYLNDNSWGARWGMFTAASLAMLQRYPSIALLAVGVLVVLAKDGWRGAWKSILPAIAGILPFMGWAVLYTYAQTGTFFGP